MRTLHKIFIGGEVIRNERTPFLARWEKNTIEGNTEQIRHYWKKKKFYLEFTFLYSDRYGVTWPLNRGGGDLKLHSHPPAVDFSGRQTSNGPDN